MRLQEICQESAISEMLLHEGFLDDIKKRIGDKTDAVINTVNSTATAMIVIYKVCSNENYRETMTHLINKSVRQRLKQLMTNDTYASIAEKISKILPRSRGTIVDFIKSVVVVSLVNMITEITRYVRDTLVGDFIENAIAKLTNLDSLINMATSMSGIMHVFEAFGIAEKILFQTLDSVNRKIKSIPIGAGA